MAELVESRRRSLRLGPQAFAEASGATLEGVRAIRKGWIKRYQDRLLLGVAEALDWPDTWYEMIQRGEDPNFVGRPSSGRTVDPGTIVEAAIEADTRLDPERRSWLIAAYRTELAAVDQSG